MTPGLQNKSDRDVWSLDKNNGPKLTVKPYNIWMLQFCNDVELQHDGSEQFGESPSL